MDKFINKITENVSKESQESFKKQLTEAINNSIPELTKEKRSKINDELIDEINNKIHSLECYLHSFKNPEDYKWELNKIVDNEICARCGTCTVVCPNNLLEFKDKPVLTNECKRNGHGMCLEVCPRNSSGKYQISIREKLFEDYYYGKSNVSGQDGGVITSFLKYLLDFNKIDGAIVVGDEQWKPVSMVITSPDDLENTSKSKYTVSTLEALSAAGEMGLEKVAVVGLPCQIVGLRKLQYLPYSSKHDNELGWDGKPVKLPKIEYLIGLFCSEKFEFEILADILEELNLSFRDVKKFDVNKGKFVIETIDGEFINIPVKDIPYASGCKMCRDFDSEMADVSVGSVGSEDGYSTIIIRSKKGEEIKNVLTLEKGVDKDQVQKLRDFKLNRFNKNLKARKDNKEFLSYYWNDDFGGVAKRPDGTYFIRVRAKPAGFYTVEESKFIINLADEYGATIKLTNRGAFELHGFKPEDVEGIVKQLHEKDLITGSEGPLVRATLACPGENNCGSALFSTVDLCTKIEDKFSEYPTPYKFKIAISGCPNKCVRPQIHDFGIAGYQLPVTDEEKCNGCGRCADVCKVEALNIRGDMAYTNYDVCVGCGKCIKACPHEAKDIKDEGYTLFVGGKAGRKLIEAVSFTVKSEDEILEKIEGVLKTYAKLAKKPQRERLASTMERIGQTTFMNEVNKL